MIKIYLRPFRICVLTSIKFDLFSNVPKSKCVCLRIANYSISYTKFVNNWNKRKNTLTYTFEMIWKNLKMNFLTVALNFETHSLLPKSVGANVITGCMTVWSADSLWALAALSNSLKCSVCFPLVTIPSPYWFSSSGSPTPWLSSYKSRRWS